MKKFMIVAVAGVLVLGLLSSRVLHAQSAQNLVADAATAIGGMEALRALKSEIVEAEGRQFDVAWPAPLAQEFVAGLQKLNLDATTIVGIHGDSASIEAARAAAHGLKP